MYAHHELDFWEKKEARDNSLVSHNTSLFYLQMREIKQESRTRITHLIIPVGESPSGKGIHRLEGNSSFYFKEKVESRSAEDIDLIEAQLSAVTLCQQPSCTDRSNPWGWKGFARSLKPGRTDSKSSLVCLLHSRQLQIRTDTMCFQVAGIMET